MDLSGKSILQLRSHLANSADFREEIRRLAKGALSHANGNQGHNTYLWRDDTWTMSEADRVAAFSRNNENHFPLLGIPISLKDCFDLAGTPTTCGTKFYGELHGILPRDSALAAQLRNSGAVITGKTHLHPLAYGITGENPDYGDCLQPNDPTALTGGSSSGAAASIQEGSAIAAIGTDTGGSIRVPAALCGIAGYRATIGRGPWVGGAHLAPSFDTIGWLFRHLEDAPILGSILAPKDTPGAIPFRKFGVISPVFLHDCDPAILMRLQQFRAQLESMGLTSTEINPEWWNEALDIFAPIQAHECAQIHQGNFDYFESSIRERLEWGASLTEAAVDDLRQRHDAFRERMDALLTEHTLLVLPAAPVARLEAGASHSQTRARLLRYTIPVSLAGMPAITIPILEGRRPAGGIQLIAAREQDASLLALAANLSHESHL